MSEITISSKQALELLKASGVQIAAISETDNPDFSVDDAMGAIDASRRKILEPQIIEAHKDRLVGEVAGRAAGTLRSEIARKTGIAKAELEGLNDKEMIEKGLAHFEAKFGKDTEGLRQEMATMAAKHNETLTKREAELLKEVEAANNKYKSHFITESLVEEIKDLTLTEGTDRLYAAKLLHRELQEMGIVNFDETMKKVSLRDKTNPELPLYNEGRTSELKPVDIATNIFGKLGMLQKDMRNTPPAGLPGAPGGTGKPNNAPANNVPSVVGNVDLVALANEHWK